LTPLSIEASPQRERLRIEPSSPHEEELHVREITEKPILRPRKESKEDFFEKLGKVEAGFVASSKNLNIAKLESALNQVNVTTSKKKGRSVNNFLKTQHEDIKNAFKQNMTPDKKRKALLDIARRKF
jgi:hypothetical protein